MRTSPAWTVTRWVLLLLFAAFFVVPLLALLDFSTTAPGTGDRTGEAWRTLFSDPQLTAAIRSSLLLCLYTVLGMVVLLVPTMVWVRLRLPLTIPALVILVGLTNVYAWVSYLFGYGSWTLVFIYVVLVLPYSYRAIDAALSSIDSTTLAEAARSLGAGWFTVIVRVIVPNIWPGVLNAAFITVALVLGEYTMASLLHFDTLPVAIVLISKANAPASMAASLGSILLAFVLLVLLGLLDRRRRTPGRKSA